jgi:hypothetical protein
MGRSTAFLLRASVPIGIAALVGFGCGTNFTGTGQDGGTMAPDSAASEDTGVGSDASRPDTGNADTGTSEISDGGGSIDTGTIDSSTSTDGCGAAGMACCTAAGGIVAAFCNTGLTCCEPAHACSAQCGSDLDASPETGVDAGVAVCGARDDAGQPQSGECPQRQFCCDEGHTGAPAWGCLDLDASCNLLP